MPKEKTHTLKTLVLANADINAIVQHYGVDTIMDELIKRVADAFETFDAEKTIIPIRSGFNYEHPHTGLVEWMPLYNKGHQVVIKIVGYHPNNPNDFSLPSIISTISTYDTATGHLKGIMDGVFLTALRTGATSAIASRMMAHPESKTLGLIGCGTQAITQFHALSREFDFERVMYYDNDPETLDSFEQRCTVLDLPTKFIPSQMEEIVREADILCMATSIDPGTGPLFANIDTKPNLHINAVGSDFAGKTELPLELLKQCFVCPDFPEQALIEGECQQLEQEDIGPEFAEIMQNQDKYKFVRNQRSVFDSTGLSLEDQAVVELFMEYAEKLKIGQEIEIEYIQDDAKNPYHFLGVEAEKLKKNEILDLLPLNGKVLKDKFAEKISKH